MSGRTEKAREKALVINRRIDDAKLKTLERKGAFKDKAANDLDQLRKKLRRAYKNAEALDGKVMGYWDIMRMSQTIIDLKWEISYLERAGVISHREMVARARAGAA